MSNLARDRVGEGGDIEINMDEILACLGKEEFEEFERVMQTCQRVLDEPTAMVGSQALIAAAQLASLRTKLGSRGQYYKTARGDQAEKLLFRRRKDLLLTIYNALEENINTLKLLGRTEAKMESWN